MEIKDEDVTTQTGICCPSYDSIRPDDFKCIIEGANGFQNPSLVLPPVELSCEQGPPGDRGQKGNAGQTGLAELTKEHNLFVIRSTGHAWYNGRTR